MPKAISSMAPALLHFIAKALEHLPPLVVLMLTRSNLSDWFAMCVGHGAFLSRMEAMLDRGDVAVQQNR